MQILRNFASQSLWRVLIVFFFFSVADLYLTWHLIERHTADVIESNPLAAIVLTSYGWIGLAGYKIALVLTFFGLSLAVERRRPIGGLLLLVFACGVHAAVVTSSAFLYLNDARTEDTAETYTSLLKEHRKLLPEGSQALLTQKLVQQELKLTIEQIRQVAHINKKRRELSREVNHGHLENCRSMFMLLTVFEHNLISEMTPVQIDRLGQLTLQKRGVLAFEDAEVMIALDLNDDQRHAVHSLFEQQIELAPTQVRGGQSVNGLFSEPEAPVKEMEANLLSVLTENQKTRWIAMQGAQFCFQTGKSLPTPMEAAE